MTRTAVTRTLTTSWRTGWPFLLAALFFPITITAKQLRDLIGVPGYVESQIRAALKEGHERVAVVCGAWHVPALTRLTQSGLRWAEDAIYLVVALVLTGAGDRAFSTGFDSPLELTRKIFSFV